MPKMSDVERNSILRKELMPKLSVGDYPLTVIDGQSMGFVATACDGTDDLVIVKLTIRKRIDGVTAEQMLNGEAEMYVAKQNEKAEKEKAKQEKIAKDKAKREAKANEVKEND